MKRTLLVLLGASLFWPAGLNAQGVLNREEFVVEGVKREALVVAPDTARSEPSPLVFAFHGHGGSMSNAARSFHLHSVWTEAMVVYPQGLNTPGRLTDPEGNKPGWQHAPGDLGDRDLKFFDIMLAALRERFKVDDRRIYATGHSNGGGFTYLLWATRGETFAAVAPSASAASRSRRLLTPKPVLHIAGEQDPLVKFGWQKATIDALIKLNQGGPGQAWDLDNRCTLYPSVLGAPVVTAIHPGGHEYPRQAPEVIVKFFKSHVKK